MKHLFLTIIGLFLFTNACQLNAQEEGYMKMEISDLTTDNKDLEPMLGMLKGTETEYFYTPDKAMVKANMMGGMMVMTSIVNNLDDSMVMYFDAMGQKMEIESTKEEREKAAEGQPKMDEENFEIKYDESDTKEILGYKCIKATIVPKNNTKGPEGMAMELYVAKDIKASNKMIKELDKFNIEGFPLEYSIVAQGMKMTYTTVEMKDELDKSVFDFDNNGYQKMSFDQFQKTMGGMQGF